jgi:bifunctional non-homologous end joining protein LigD
MSLAFISPCSPTTAKRVPAGLEWVHEPKLDGYRLQVAKEGTTVRLYSQRGFGWTNRLAALAEALKGITCRSAVLDAELVGGNLYSLRRRRPGEFAVFAFDLLHHNGRDLRPLPLIERRRQLKRLISRSPVPCLHLVLQFDDGETLFASAERLGLEGVVSKRRQSPYRSGRSRDWLKVKTMAWREASRERWRLFEKT